MRWNKWKGGPDAPITPIPTTFWIESYDDRDVRRTCRDTTQDTCDRARGTRRGTHAALCASTPPTLVSRLMIRVQISKLTIKLMETPKPLPDVETLQFGVVILPQLPLHSLAFIVPQVIATFRFNRHRSWRADRSATISDSFQRPHSHRLVPSCLWMVSFRNQTVWTAHARSRLILPRIWRQHIRGHEGASFRSTLMGTRWEMCETIISFSSSFLYLHYLTISHCHISH